MKIRHWFAVACSAALCTGTALAAPSGGSAAAPDLEGLAKVKSKQFDSVYVLPGADFRGYTKILLDQTQVAFAKNWLSDMNSNRVTILTRTTAEDAEQIAGQMRTGFDDIFAKALEKAGYEIVATPGAGVLRLTPRVIDLYVNAPKSVTQSLPASSVRTANAGQATLVLEARDSTTAAMLERVHDRRTAGLQGNFRLSVTTTTPTSNRFDFENLFDAWAQAYVKGLEELKARSPVVTTSSMQQH